MQRTLLVRTAARAIALTVAFAGAACHDQPPPTATDANAHAPSRMVKSVSGVAVPEARMRSLLTELTRAVAIALSDPVLRRLVYNEMEASPFRESKLHFGPFLRQRGSALAGAMASADNATRDHVLSALDSVVDLEFYMPVDDHRGRWTGGPDLLVATALHDDGTTPTGFDLTGTEVPLVSARTPPATPTLAIVPRETDFSQAAAVSPSQAQAASTASGAGVYMTSAYIPDSHEGWLMGDPEFELHAFVQQPSGAYVDVTCSGGSQNDPFRYDHNDQVWSGDVLVITEQTLGEAEVEFQMWEDDTDACTSSAGRPPKTDDATIWGLGGWASLVYAIVFESGLAQVTAGLLIVPATLDLVSSLHKDDLVGILELPGGCFDEQQGPEKFVIRSEENGPLAGNAYLDFRMGDERTPACSSGSVPPPSWTVSIAGPLSISDEATCTWAASVSGGTSPYSYGWYRDGVQVSTMDYYTGGMDGLSVFELHLWVIDANGAQLWDEIAVGNGGSGWCLE